MKIHVGNLSQEVSEEEIRDAFEKIGQVDTITITKNKYNGKTKVFAFVVMKSGEDGQSAIDSLNGKELKGMTLKVSGALADTESSGDKGEGDAKGGFGGGKRGPGGVKGGFGGSKGHNSGKGGFGSKKGFSGGRGGRGR